MSAECIGRYRVEEVLRIEPVGRLARASVPELNRRVYLQELCPPSALGAADRERLIAAFEKGCRLLAQLEDPRLPRPHDAQATPGGGRYLAFERPEEAGFQPLPPPSGRFAPAVCAHVASEACAGLAALLEADLAVYWFDPETVFLSPAGEVRMLPPLLSHLPVRLGLPKTLAAPSAYAAPEVLAGERGTQAALVYSVAAWAYAVLSRGVIPNPAGGREPEALWKFNPDVPATLQDVVQAALHPNPARRFRTLRAFREALGGRAMSRIHAAAAAEAAGVGAAPIVEVGPMVEVGPEAEMPPLLRFAGWTVGLGVAGALLGWMAGILLPPR